MMPHTVFKMPLSFDEIGKIDTANLLEFVKIADFYNFTIVGALPNMSAELAAVLGKFINLDAFSSAAEVYPNFNVVYFKEIENLSRTRDNEDDYPKDDYLTLKRPNSDAS